MQQQRHYYYLTLPTAPDTVYHPVLVMMRDAIVVEYPAVASGRSLCSVVMGLVTVTVDDVPTVSLTAPATRIEFSDSSIDGVVHAVVADESLDHLLHLEHQYTVHR
jgi:hypothetical protein